ncbi:hypothetical protein CFN78_26060 [Amycolatopsis antarctica]|uniref:Uncharacterized protein n=1 Tax=Amycolatopsis antarctica TaxID=1854586 RepID=A0A263CW71_9PSEU|nr:hypothetical protein [Amycolatopsis antarctica]OZM70384.1 hypothetical protein CFN78_26060 [Amycolatopsis antarctica]
MDTTDGGLGSGFWAEPETLTQLARQVFEASETLSASTRQVPNAPDAGASSAIVGTALARVQTAGTVLVEVLAQVAGKVDTARGRYDAIDNTAAGALRWEKIPHQTPLTDLVRGNDLLETKQDIVDLVQPSGPDCTDPYTAATESDCQSEHGTERLP